MPTYEQPLGLPARLLSDTEMINACAERDFSTIFALAKARGGFYPSLIARRCDMTPSRVSEVLSGKRVIKDMSVIERVADGLRIPGHMLGLTTRDWEVGDGSTPASTPAGSTATWPPWSACVDEPWTAIPDEATPDPEFVATLVENQLPQLYTGANFFGAAQSIPTVTHYAQIFIRLLKRVDGSARHTCLRTGSRVSEFLGWLHQDLGDFRLAAYWSDRSMEWAQEAADDHMQSYVLFRKSHQATARANAQQAVGLARAAQRLPDLSLAIKALAVQQEAAAYALQQNPKAALARFDEAHALASEVTDHSTDSTLDTTYCTPAYIEIQRASCWIDLGEPMRAVQLFEDKLGTLPQVFRNDRGVYLARLARAYVAAKEIDQGAQAASKALAIVAQTGSARTFSELVTVANAIGAQQGTSTVTAFSENYELIRRQFAGQPDVRGPGDERCWGHG